MVTSLYFKIYYLDRLVMRKKLKEMSLLALEVIKSISANLSSPLTFMNAINVVRMYLLVSTFPTNDMTENFLRKL